MAGRTLLRELRIWPRRFWIVTDFENSAGMYYTLTGKIGLGGQLDNDRYPHIKVQTFRDFLRSRVG